MDAPLIVVNLSLFFTSKHAECSKTVKECLGCSKHDFTELPVSRGIPYDQKISIAKKVHDDMKKIGTDIYDDHHKVLVAVDCIILGFDGSELKVLLVKRSFEPEAGKWSLVGGFVSRDESTKDAAGRILFDLTGLKGIHMEQIGAFSSVDREHVERVVSIAYFALVKIGPLREMPDSNRATWLPMANLPLLIFDHQKMILRAKELLKLKASHGPIGFELLPEKFTIPQLRLLYEAIHEKRFDQRNFAKRILAFDILKKSNEKEKSSKKGAFYYFLDQDKYEGIKNRQTIAN